MLFKTNFKNIFELETKYQTEKKEKENLQLKVDKAEQELVIEQEQRAKTYLSLGIILSLGFLGFMYFFLRKTRKQKNTIENLQKELHHRIKNNLGIISAFVEVAEREKTIENLAPKLTDLKNRITSIYETHEQLYKNKDLTQANLYEYLSSLTTTVAKTFNKNNITIELNVDSKLNLEADKLFPVGLMVNEFVTNSYKYAFDENQNGLISISLHESKKAYRLSMKDSGIGLPKDFDIEKNNSFGMKIIQLLSEQLEGSFDLKSNPGTEIIVEF